jgi:hypothetical protein
LGEGHTSHGSNRKYGFDVLARHVDLHVKHFRRTQRVVSDDFVFNIAIRYDGSLAPLRRDGEMYFFPSFGCRNNKISSHTWHKETIRALFEVKLSDKEDRETWNYNEFFGNPLPAAPRFSEPGRQFHATTALEPRPGRG